MNNVSVTKMCIAEIATQLQAVHDAKHCAAVDPQADYIWDDDSPDGMDGAGGPPSSD